MKDIITKHLKFNFETSLYLLLFIFPLFALSVRHWSSITFSLLTLVGIVYYFVRLKKEPLELHKYEKIFIWSLVAYFISFLLSMSIHYPDRFSETQFGNEVRFILVIPLYFLLTKHPDGFRWLVYGAAASIFISFGFCLYELYVMGHPVFLGEYSKLFTGPIILIYLVLVLSYFIPKLSRQKLGLWFFLAVLCIIATFSIITSEVRSAYIGYLVLAILFPLLYVHGWKKYLYLVALVLLITTMSITSVSINYRMKTSINDFMTYMSMENKADPRKGKNFGSLSVRLELWRSAPLFVKDHPLIGVGNGNFNDSIKKYIKQGLINPIAADYDHAHNVFVEATVDKGLLGLIVTGIIFFFPFFVYIKTYRRSKFSAFSGIIYTVVMFIISMNEAAPFNKSNFVATYLILSLVIFQNHMKELKIKSLG